MANFTGAEGLNRLAHSLLNRGAKAMMKNELRMPNQDAGISVSDS